MGYDLPLWAFLETRKVGKGGRKARLLSSPRSARAETPAALADVAPAWRLEEWLRALTDLSDASVRAYEDGVRSFVRWVQRSGVASPESVTRLVLRRYLAYLATRRYARQTVAQRASALRRYFRWLSRKGVVAVDPTAGLSARTGGTKLPRVPSRWEVEVLLDDPPLRAVEVPEAVRLRDDVVVELLYGSGLRVERAVRDGPWRYRPRLGLGNGLGEGFQAAAGPRV